MNIKNQIESIVTDSDLNLSDERKILRKELNKDSYIIDKPKKVNINNQKYYNPAVKMYSKFLDWDNGWYPVDEMEVLQYCPEYIPTDEAIKKLIRKDILEIGASNGYWSHIINENGGYCFPTDVYPLDVILQSEEYVNFHNKMKNGRLITDIQRKTEIYPYFETYKVESDSKTNKRHNLIWTRVHMASQNNQGGCSDP